MPPPGWTPSPPPPWPTEGDTTAWTRTYIRLATDLLNATNGDPDAFLAHVLAWAPASTPDSAWVYIADLDDDGAPEWLVSLPRLERQCFSGRCTPFFRCDASLCPSLVLLFEREKTRFTPVHLFTADPWNPWLEHPRIFTVEDLNGDGDTELVLRTDWCGAHTCGTRLLVGRWDGQVWHDLAADGIEQTFTEIVLEDRDGDGTKEIVMHGGIVGSAGAGLQRKHTRVYAWREGRYRLVEDVPDPDPHIYFRMLDANAALAKGDLNRALTLAMEVIKRPAPEHYREAFVDEWAQVRIRSYAAIEAMLVYALRHEPEAMEALLRQVETKYDRLDNPYVEAARRLWQTYRGTRDPLAACGAMERAVRERRDQAAFFRWYGYNTERLPLERICPLDGTLGSTPSPGPSPW